MVNTNIQNIINRETILFPHPPSYTFSTDTVEFYPKNSIMPASSSDDRLTMILTDLLETLQHPHPSSPFLRYGTKLNDAIRAVQQLVKTANDTLHPPLITTPEPTTAAPTQAPTTPSRQPSSPPTQASSTSSSLDPVLTYPIGTIVKKQFGSQFYEGEIVSYDPKNEYFKIRYRDGDIEELTPAEVRQYRKTRQYYARALLSNIEVNTCTDTRSSRIAPLRARPSTRGANRPTQTEPITVRAPPARNSSPVQN